LLSKHYKAALVLCHCPPPLHLPLWEQLCCAPTQPLQTLLSQHPPSHQWSNLVAVLLLLLPRQLVARHLHPLVPHLYPLLVPHLYKLMVYPVAGYKHLPRVCMHKARKRQQQGKKGVGQGDLAETLSLVSIMCCLVQVRESKWGRDPMKESLYCISSLEVNVSHACLL
jgi:hypothetical protein